LSSPNASLLLAIKPLNVDLKAKSVCNTKRKREIVETRDRQENERQYKQEKLAESVSKRTSTRDVRERRKKLPTRECWMSQEGQTPEDKTKIEEESDTDEDGSHLRT
jgi:hypothetical protein